MFLLFTRIKLSRNVDDPQRGKVTTEKVQNTLRMSSEIRGREDPLKAEGTEAVTYLLNQQTRRRQETGQCHDVQWRFFEEERRGTTSLRSMHSPLPVEVFKRLFGGLFLSRRWPLKWCLWSGFPTGRLLMQRRTAARFKYLHLLHIDALLLFTFHLDTFVEYELIISFSDGISIQKFRYDIKL